MPHSTEQGGDLTTVMSGTVLAVLFVHIGAVCMGSAALRYSSRPSSVLGGLVPCKTPVLAVEKKWRHIKRKNILMVDMI